MPDSCSFPSISLFFPVYNDESTVRIVAEKAIRFLSNVTEVFEIIIINDASPDKSGIIADQLAREHNFIRVIHHPTNLGYGAAIRRGLVESKYEWICFTDGDDEYDVFDFYKLARLKDFYDLIITFRYVKLYSSFRQFMSWGYNVLFRFMFRTNYRDISTALRMVKRSLINELNLESDSAFIGAEITIKTMLKGFRVGEVGIQTFPRRFNSSSMMTLHNIRHALFDMIRIYNKIFSKGYDMPKERLR